MRLLLRGVVAAAVLSLAPVAVVTTTAAPAQAAATVSTKTTFNPDVKKRGVYGATFIISGAVKATNDPDGYESPFVGTAYLQRKAPGAQAWKNVASDDSPGFAYFPNYDKYTGNAQFRIYYTGGTYSPGTSSERTYLPQASKAISVKVSRKLDFKDVSKGAKGRGKVKVTPKFGGKKLLIQTKKGGKFKTTRKVKMNRKGQAVIAFQGSRKGITYRLVAPGNKQFVATTGKVTYKRY